MIWRPGRKILVINGSARKGNTDACVNAFVEGAHGANEVEVLEEMKALGASYCS